MTDINPNNNLTDKVKALLDLLNEIEANLSAFDDVALLDISVGKSAFAVARVMPLVKLDLEAIIQLLTDSETWLSLSNDKFDSLLSNMITVTSLLTAIRDCVCRTASATEALLALEVEDEDDCIFSEFTSDAVAFGILAQPSIQIAQTPVYSTGVFPPQVDLSSGLLTGELNVVTIPDSEVVSWRVKFVTDAQNVYLYDGLSPVPAEVLTPDTWYQSSVVSGKAAFIDRTTIGKRKKRKSRRYSDFASRGIVAVWCYNPSIVSVADLQANECLTLVSQPMSETHPGGTFARHAIRFQIRGQGIKADGGGSDFTTVTTPPVVAVSDRTDDIGMVVLEATAPVLFITDDGDGISVVDLPVDAGRFWRAGHSEYWIISEQPFVANICHRFVS